MFPKFQRPPQINNRGFLSRIDEAVRLAATGEHTVKWNRFRDEVSVTIGGYAIMTNEAGLQRIKRATLDGKARKRRQRHDPLGILRSAVKRFTPRG